MAEQHEINLADVMVEEVEVSTALARQYIAESRFTEAFNELNDAMEELKTAQSNLENME